MSIIVVLRVPEVEVATAITSSGFVQPVSSALRDDVAVHLRGGELVYSIGDNGRVVGFAIFTMWNDVLYLNGIQLHKDYQGRGIAGRVVAHARRECRPRYLALRTQSLRMWVAGKRILGSVMGYSWCPKPSGDMSPEVKDVRERLAKHLGMTSIEQAGFYGAPLYGAKPTYHDPKLQAWWDGICDFERGDAVLCVGVFLYTSDVMRERVGW